MAAEAIGIEAYRGQIDNLKEAAGDNVAYSQQLDAWLEAIENASAGAAASETGISDERAPSDDSVTVPDAETYHPADSETLQTTADGQTQGNDNPIGPVGLSGDAQAEVGDIDWSAQPEALKRLAPMIEEASEATGVPPDLLEAMVWQESRGVSEASTVNGGNGAADSGLMQINSATFEQLKQDHPELQGGSVTADATNIMAAALFMADLKDQFGDWDLALRGYNSGAGSVDPSDPNVTTTGLGDPTYVTKVNDFADLIEDGSPLPP